MIFSNRVVLQSRWDLRPPRGGTAVVIDVLRFSTTLCALLTAGRKDIRATDTPEALLQSAGLKSADLFSELDFEFSGRRFDNSPELALRHGRADRIAYVTTTSGSRALWASRGASRVFIGCFANFDAILRRLRKVRGRIWFVPAAPPIRPSAIEDELCAKAFIQGLRGRKDAARQAISKLRQTSRIAEFFALRLRTGRKDLAYCLDIDGLPVIPEAVFFPHFGGKTKISFARIRKAQ